jgi:hypothetical protein
MAEHYADLYIVPVVAHIIGNNNTAFVSDLAIQNFQSTPLTVSLIFIESGLGNSENVDNLVSTAVPSGSVTVPAGGSVILRDIVDGYQGRHEALIGSLLVSADRAFAVTSRAYGTTASGTVGQSVVPVRDFIENRVGDTDNTLAVAYVPGLTNNVTFRSNLGFVAAAGDTDLVVEVKVRGADGATLGTRSFTVPAQQFAHLQFSTNDVGAGTFDAAGAEFRILSGDGAVTPYASILDNRNADAIFVAGVFPENTPFAFRSPIESRFRRLVHSFR